MTMALDGQAHANFALASGPFVTLTTAHSGDIICVFITTNGGPITAVTSTSGLTFARRATSNTAGAGFPIEFWWAYAASALTSEVITAGNTSTAFTTMDAFGVSGTVGFNSSNPFDSNGSLPAIETVGGTDVLVSTTTANSFIIGGYRVGTASPTEGTGFTKISGADFQLVEYKIVSGAQTNLDITIGTGAGGQNGGIGDALIETGGGGATFNPGWTMGATRTIGGVY